MTGRLEGERLGIVNKGVGRQGTLGTGSECRRSGGGGQGTIPEGIVGLEVDGLMRGRLAT